MWICAVVGFIELRFLRIGMECLLDLGKVLALGKWFTGLLRLFNIGSRCRV